MSDQRPGQPPIWQNDPWRGARAKAEGAFSHFRNGTRGLLLPLFTWPLLFDVVVEVVRGNTRGLVAAGLGILLPILAVRILRRGRRGDTRRAAVLVAVATGLVALLGANMAMPIPLILAAGAWLGTRLLYDGAQVEVDPPAPAVPPPPPGPLEEARIRLARVTAEPRMAGIAQAMDAVLDDLEARPDRLPLARRFLAVHLDGLDRIAQRLAAGAEPPASLPQLLTDMQTAADELRTKLRAEESVALDIQVKVLAERLRQEGYA
ncbi:MULTISPECIES: 5-bromo-4-chloroindolyl phosphate hydrolysis family protein [Roseomonadaceae]|uniref:5-bromo-4-chloroindolyl phosphate hydrolase n=1 Tax=Falsiroseomonas oleicola TaxID=2801474 RepID=A0ABS6H9U7_9PROT|nr:5-bromo-4-chloroindolyl phosphate hydrolysis family protein [Roseomonas oleicola]MBU8545476.1 hypothetical protein [Roseomonas oleicola]